MLVLSSPRVFPFALAPLAILPGLWWPLASTAQTPSTTTATLQEVTISGALDTGYRARTARVAGFDDVPLRDIPASVSVITRERLDDQQARLLSDVVRNDASVGDNYTPVGYYENVNIRGVPLDLATGYQINGMSSVGEQNVMLENKSRVEILKGLAGLQAGVLAPAGLINYVTKRPTDIREVTLGTDQRGGRYIAADVGTRFGGTGTGPKPFGLRVNLVHEDMQSYVDHADGHRNGGALAFDWNITPSTVLQLDAEYQKRAQRSVPGFQLLGGTSLPHDISPRQMLNDQPWSKPVTMEAHNLNLRLDHAFSESWRAAFSASRSRAIIDDNVAFPYGCYAVPSCDPAMPGSTPGQFFAADGSYDVYDYRSPGDKRRNDQAQATLTGNIGSGAIRHEVTFGASVFRRTVDLRESVFDWVGTDNIYNPTPLTFDPAPRDPGPAYRALDSRQRAVFLQDRIRIGEQWQIIGGARHVWLTERTPAEETTRKELLPQAAVIFQPTSALSFYGSYSKGLSLGGQAPAWTTNAYAFLKPTISHQWEAGARYDWRDALTLSLTAFRLNKPFEYAQPDASAFGSTFVQQGKQIHQGVELAAAGRVTTRLQLSASVTALRARQTDSGTLAYDGQQVINTPRLRSAVFADYAIPGVEGLALLGGWTYTSSKQATRDGLVAIPAVHRFDAGLRYATKLGATHATFLLMVDNVFNKHYWKDVGESLGDGYLHRGAPRTARLTARFNF